MNESLMYMSLKASIMIRSLNKHIIIKEIKFFSNKEEMNEYVERLAEFNKIDKSLITLTFEEVSKENIYEINNFITSYFNNKQKFTREEVMLLLLNKTL